VSKINCELAGVTVTVCGWLKLAFRLLARVVQVRPGHVIAEVPEAEVTDRQLCRPSHANVNMNAFTD
jgi:hypothetical protein